LKQARAFGVGVVLATQNAVDLDYKGLANTGTWFIGRLQTERDKARVLEGLEGASAGSGQRFDRKRMEETLAGLGNRIFLMNNVHEDQPVIFESRWALSYLRGPLTRTQIKTLMDPVKRETLNVKRETSGASRSAPGTSHPPGLDAPGRAVLPGHSALATRPVLPPGVPQSFVPVRGTQPKGSSLVYCPMVLGLSQVRYVDSKKGLEAVHDEAHVMPVDRAVTVMEWDRSRAVIIVRDDLEPEPNADARFWEIAPAAGQPKNYDDWKKAYATWLFQTAKLDLSRSPSTKEVSKPGESERDFRVRLQQVARERRDAAAEKLRQKYGPKIATLQDRIRRAEQAVEREKEQAKQTGLQAALSVGATILGAFMGRKSLSATTIGKASTALGKAGRTMKDVKDVGMAQDNVSALQEQLVELEAQFKSETDSLSLSDPLSEPLETVALRPTKSNISVKLIALAWLPHWQDATGTLLPAYA